jgi:hypothetical protein
MMAGKPCKPPAAAASGVVRRCVGMVGWSVTGARRDEGGDSSRVCGRQASQDGPGSEHNGNPGDPRERLERRRGVRRNVAGARCVESDQSDDPCAGTNGMSRPYRSKRSIQHSLASLDPCAPPTPRPPRPHTHTTQICPRHRAPSFARVPPRHHLDRATHATHWPLRSLMRRHSHAPSVDNNLVLQPPCRLQTLLRPCPDRRYMRGLSRCRASHRRVPALLGFAVGRGGGCVGAGAWAGGRSCRRTNGQVGNCAGGSTDKSQLRHGGRRLGEVDGQSQWQEAAGLGRSLLRYAREVGSLARSHCEPQGSREEGQR